MMVVHKMHDITSDAAKSIVLDDVAQNAFDKQVLGEGILLIHVHAVVRIDQAPTFSQ
jgi:hypothetical protein